MGVTNLTGVHKFLHNNTKLTVLYNIDIKAYTNTEIKLL